VPNLFLSSASGDDDGYVETFFLDLCQRIDVLVGDRVTDRSFLAITSGQARDWAPGADLALGRCDAFLAICSPRFFLNQTCGRHWWVFEERLRQCEERSGTRPAALIAMAWTLDATIPSNLRAVLHGEQHRGLRQLVRLRSLRDLYQRTLTELAEQILHATGTASIPWYEPMPSMSETRNAFEVGAAGVRRTENVPSIRFVVAAGTRSEMQDIRKNLVFYGGEREEWAPYLPASPTPIAQRARTVAAARLFESEIGSIDDIADRIDRARRDNELVVVLVDSWATHVDACQQVLAELDARGLRGAAVLVPTNFADAETASNHEELRFELRRTFHNSISNPDVLLRAEVESPDRFDVDLAGLIEEARNRSFREGQVRTLPAGSPPADRPLLRGP
jgi:FxsC-like protein